MKRIAIMALLILSAGIAPTVRAALFVDTVNHPHEVFIDEVANLGIVQGYGNKIFRPDIPINRAEFLKILMLAVNGLEGIGIQDTHCFADFEGEPKWYWLYACDAKSRGVVQGYPDGTFRGDQTVNLAEAFKIAMEAWGIPVSDQKYEPEYWYIPYFEVAATRGLFTYFPEKAGHLLTRSEMAYLIVSMGEPLQDVSGNSQIPDTGILPYECGNSILEPGEQCDDGNTENDDGCSALCILVDQPVHHSALRIDQRPVSAFSISEGAEGVTLFSFDALAGRQDAAITHVVFQAQNGSLISGNSYQIFIDNTGDGIANILVANGTVDVQAGTLTFPSLSIPVQEGYSTRIELRGNIIDSSSSGTFSIEFATGNSRFVEGVGLIDGRDVTGIELNGAECTETFICWISVHTIDNPTFNLLGRGNLYVTKDSTSVSGMQMLAGQTTTDLLRLDFRAVGEDIIVNSIRISAEDRVFQQLLLYDEEGSFPLATAWTTDCDPADSDLYCASNVGWTIRKNEEKTLIVRGIVSSDGQGIISGTTTAVSIIPDGSVLVIEAEGSSSHEDLVLNNDDSTEEGEVFIGIDSPGTDAAITGSTHKVVLAKISGVENTNTDSDQSIVPTGTAAFGIFKFTAAENNNTQGGKNVATIEQITFAVNATNVEFLADSFVLYNPAEGSVTATCAAGSYTGQIAVLCSGLADSSVNTAIESGEFIELVLRGFITNSQVNAGSVSALRASLNPLGSRTTAGAVKWTDEEISLEWIDIGKTNVQSTAYFNN